MLCCPSFTISAWSNVKAPGILHKPSFQRSGPCNKETDIKKMMYFVGASSDSELPHCREKEIVTIWSFFLQLPQVASSWECLIFKDLRVRVGDLQCGFTVWYLLWFGAFPTMQAADNIHSLLPHPFSSRFRARCPLPGAAHSLCSVAGVTSMQDHN